MRTITLKDVLYEVAVGAGMKPDSTDNLDLVLGRAWVRYVTRRVKEGLEYEFWPDTMLVEERWYRSDWSAATAYATGDEVYYAAGDAYYIALQAGTNKNPSTETSYWSALESDEFDRYVGWSQTGKTAIGRVELVSDKHPYKKANIGRLAWELSANGIQVSTLADTSVFVKYQVRPGVYSFDVWDSTRTYAVGDYCYYAATGEAYKAILSGSNKNPSTQTTYWTRQDIPEAIGSFVKLAVTADVLRDNGRGRDADVIEEKAYAELENAYTRQILAQGQTHSVTYSSAY